MSSQSWQCGKKPHLFRFCWRSHWNDHYVPPNNQTLHLKEPKKSWPLSGDVEYWFSQVSAENPGSPFRRGSKSDGNLLGIVFTGRCFFSTQKQHIPDGAGDDVIQMSGSVTAFPAHPVLIHSPLFLLNVARFTSKNCFMIRAYVHYPAKTEMCMRSQFCG